jgi:hypothetical protein
MTRARLLLLLLVVVLVVVVVLTVQMLVGACTWPPTGSLLTPIYAGEDQVA